jgi:hypothetical protein
VTAGTLLASPQRSTRASFLEEAMTMVTTYREPASSGEPHTVSPADELLALTVELIACLQEDNFDSLALLEERRTAALARFLSSQTSRQNSADEVALVQKLEAELSALLIRKREELAAQRLAAAQSTKAGRAYAAQLSGGNLDA